MCVFFSNGMASLSELHVFAFPYPAMPCAALAASCSAALDVSGSMTPRTFRRVPRALFQVSISARVNARYCATLSDSLTGIAPLEPQGMVPGSLDAAEIDFSCTNDLQNGEEGSVGIVGRCERQADRRWTCSGSQPSALA